MSIKDAMADAISAGEDPGQGLKSQSEVVTTAREQDTPRQVTPSKNMASTRTLNTSKVNQENIEVILSLNIMFNGYDEGTQEMLAQFMGAEPVTSSVIFKALQAEQSQINALEAIAKCKGMGSAERAFFLVASKPDLLSSMMSQLADIKGLPDDTPTRITDANKIDICKILEAIISSIEDEEMDVINKITNFLLTTKGME